MAKKIILFCCGLLLLPTCFAEYNPFQSISKPIENKIIQLHYAKASAIAKLIRTKKLGFLSDQGAVTTIGKSNRLLLHVNPKRLATIRAFIAKLDKPPAQILLKAKIITITKNRTAALGAFVNELRTSSTGMHIDLPANQTGTFTLPILKLAQSHILQLKIHALTEAGLARLISSPELITLNHHPATIEAGEEIPYQAATTSGATSVAFKKAVLRLTVTPSVLPGKNILLNIQINQDKVSSLTVQGVPAIRTQQLHTEVLLKNQQTVILGGIFERDDATQIQGIPGLERLPLLGGLFRHRQRQRSWRELYILITPRLLSFDMHPHRPKLNLQFRAAQAHRLNK